MMNKCNCGGMKCMCGPAMVAHVLVLIGAINWGLIGIGGFVNGDMSWNVVHLILQALPPQVEWLVYILVGVAAIAKIIGCKCKTCMGGAMDAKMMDDKKMMDKKM